jgi:hypothetical protein
VKLPESRYGMKVSLMEAALPDFLSAPPVWSSPPPLRVASAEITIPSVVNDLLMLFAYEHATVTTVRLNVRKYRSKGQQETKRKTGQADRHDSFGLTSFSLSPTAFVLLCRSLPARSTRLSLLTFSLTFFTSSSRHA